MKLVLDINVWIDIGARHTVFPQSVELLRRIEDGGHTACLPLCGYTTIYYIMSRLLSVAAAADFLHLLQMRGVRMLGFTNREVSLAGTLSFSDHEDACVAATALNQGADLIVTRDCSGFKRSPVIALTPAMALKRL